MLSSLCNQTFGDQSFPDRDWPGTRHVQTCLQPFIKGITRQPSDQNENAGGWMFFPIEDLQMVLNMIGILDIS